MLLTRHEMNTTTSLSEHRYKALKQSMDKQREQFYIEVARLQKQFKDGGIPKHIISLLKRLLLATNTDLKCPVCLEHIGNNLVITRCGHMFCSSCHEKLNQCAMCRLNLVDVK